MKNTFKVLGIIALLAVIGFSMAACDDDGSGDTIYGCAYSKKAKYQDDLGTYTDYLLTISYNDALAKLISHLGPINNENDFYFDTLPEITKGLDNWVLIEYVDWKGNDAFDRIVLFEYENGKQKHSTDFLPPK